MLIVIGLDKQNFESKIANNFFKESAKNIC